MTVKYEIWMVLRAHRSGLSRRELMALTGRSAGSVEKALDGLRKGHNARHRGTYSTAGRWYAVLPEPIDRRGLHPNSIRNREKGQQLNATWAKLTCGMLPSGGTELERAWPMR